MTKKLMTISGEERDLALIREYCATHGRIISAFMVEAAVNRIRERIGEA